MAKQEESYQDFVMVARNGNLPMIQRMLTGENPVPANVIFLATLLFLACQYGHLTLV